MYTELQFISDTNIERLATPCSVRDYDKVFQKLVKEGKPFQMKTKIVKPSFRIEDCKYKDDKQEVQNRIDVLRRAITTKSPTDNNSIWILKANVNSLLDWQMGIKSIEITTELKVIEPLPIITKPVKKSNTKPSIKAQSTTVKRTVVSDAAARSMIGDFLKKQ